MKSTSWQSKLNYDPIAPLLNSDNDSITFFARHDLLGLSQLDVKQLWNLKDAVKITRKQQDDGSWVYPSPKNKVRSIENYNQLETFRQLGFLVELFGFDKRSAVIKQAAEYLFSFQTMQGDIRGILGNQYTPYYTAAMLELLIKSGYGNDDRIHRAFTWLNDIRQDDGGWAIPLRTINRNLDVISFESETLEPDNSKPSSNLVTGVVLRAYAAHDKYRQTPEAQAACGVLAERLFTADKYPDRKSADYWTRFTFPFWFTDLISAMDSLSKLGHTTENAQIEKAINWFVENQQENGLWQLRITKNPRLENELWLSLAICRIFKRIFG